MQGNYQKFVIEMKLKNHRYRLWKHAADEVDCILETYKEKRSIFFSVHNLLPSKALQPEGKSEYRLILLGLDQGEIMHKDFGAFYIHQNGEGSFFQKFSGPSLSCYTHCILAAADDESGELDIVYQGETPFFVPQSEENRWQVLLRQCERDASPIIRPFSPEADETGADWYRIDAALSLPDILSSCSVQIEKYQHYIIGKNNTHYYIGIPGRFLLNEQPCREEHLFQLWQPLCGGEKFFKKPEEMDAVLQDQIFGYWIAGVNLESGALEAV